MSLAPLIPLKPLFPEGAESLYPQLFTRDAGAVIERRVKVLTEGKDDTADPCTPVEIELPNGNIVWGLYFSGGRVIYYSSMQELLKGGARPFDQIEVCTRDGKPLMMQPFHLGEAIWDTELVVYERQTATGAKVRTRVGHGGMMERVSPDTPCNVAHHNYRRSRHAFSVEFSVDHTSERDLGKIREVWKNIGPVHGNKPASDGRWISRDEDQVHAHGYGSRMICDTTGEPWRDADGSMWMAYEEVTEEKILPNGSRLPYGTQIFARRMNEELSLAVGEPVLLSTYVPWDRPQQPFKASHRRDPHGQHAGFLVEGPNPLLMKFGDKEYWVIFFSAGDFVSEYGNFMMYRDKEEGPIGPYRHVVDGDGELINLTDKLTKHYDLTWTGRLNPFYDQEGKLWGLMHGIFKCDIPEGWVKSGWPRSPEEFICYARRVFLVPLEIGFNQGQPLVIAGQ